MHSAKPTQSSPDVEIACGIRTTFDPPLTRKLRHSVHSTMANTAKDHESFAAALREGRWAPLSEYGIYPVWLFVEDVITPTRVAEYRSGVLLLHTFTSVADRDAYLAEVQHGLAEPLIPSRKPHPAKRNTSPYDFSFADSPDPDPASA